MKLEAETEAAVKAAKGEQRDGADLLRGGTLVQGRKKREELLEIVMGRR